MKRDELVMVEMDKALEFTARMAAEGIRDHDIMRDCLQRGMKMPFIIMLGQPNGTVYAYRLYDKQEGRTSTLLVAHREPASLAYFPIIIILDQNDQAYITGEYSEWVEDDEWVAG